MVVLGAWVRLHNFQIRAGCAEARGGDLIKETAQEAMYAIVIYSRRE